MTSTGIRRAAAIATTFALAALTSLVAVSPARAQDAPVITGLSQGEDVTVGGARIAIFGDNLGQVQHVFFGGEKGTHLHVLGSDAVAVTVPRHKAGWVSVRVVTPAGESAPADAAKFRFAPLSMTTTKINGGWTAAQEQSVSAKFKPGLAARRAVPIAAKSSSWTPAMGTSAVRRALPWKGLPYSFAGGTTSGPSTGVCDPNVRGRWFDCRVWGFDCSGLVLYAWAPYQNLAHYAATQYGQAGRFHPSLSSLRPGDLLFYSSDHSIAGIYHVQLYIGHGEVVQAGQSGYPVNLVTLPGDLGPDYFGASRPMSVGKQGAAASVSRISQATGSVAGGNTITVRGNHFSTASTVLFGNQRIYDFKVFSNNAIQVKVPPQTSAVSVTVKVGNAWGTSRPVPSAVYTYVASVLAPAHR